MSRSSCKYAIGERVRREADLREMTRFIFWNLNPIRGGVFPNQHGLVAFVVNRAGNGGRADLKSEMRAFQRWLKDYDHTKKKSHSPSDSDTWVMLVTPRDGISVTDAAEEVENLLWFTRQEYHGTSSWPDRLVELEKERAHNILAEYGLAYRETAPEDEPHPSLDSRFGRLPPDWFRPSLN